MKHAHAYEVLRALWAKDLESTSEKEARKLREYHTEEEGKTCMLENPMFFEYTEYQRKEGKSSIPFDLEQAIMRVWTTVDDMDLPLSKEVIKELLDARCEALWAEFEKSLKNG